MKHRAINHSFLHFLGEAFLVPYPFALLVNWFNVYIDWFANWLLFLSQVCSRHQIWSSYLSKARGGYWHPHLAWDSKHRYCRKSLCVSLRVREKESETLGNYRTWLHDKQIDVEYLHHGASVRLTCTTIGRHLLQSTCRMQNALDCPWSFAQLQTRVAKQHKSLYILNKSLISATTICFPICQRKKGQGSCLTQNIIHWLFS